MDKKNPFKNITVENTAILLIDVQKKYDSLTANRIAYRINSMANNFRAIGFPIYGVYVGDMMDDNKITEIDFLHYKPKETDTLVRKFTQSAFTSNVRINEAKDTFTTNQKTNFQKFLESKNIYNVILCGGYFSLCLGDTALDAQRNFNTFVIEDLTTDTGDGLNDERAKKWMEKKGISFIKAIDVLRLFKNKKTQISSVHTYKNTL